MDNNGNNTKVTIESYDKGILLILIVSINYSFEYYHSYYKFVEAESIYDLSM